MVSAAGFFCYSSFHSHLTRTLNLRQISPPRTRSFITRRCGRWISVTLITIDPAKIRDVEIVKTIVGGKTVWDSNQNATDNKGR